MAVIFCDSATGSDSDDGSTWALAKATLQAAVTAAGAGGTVYLGDTHAEAAGASTTLTLPATTNNPVYIISSDVLTGTDVAYTAAANVQFDVNAGGSTADLSFDGNAVIVGCWFKVDDNFVSAQGSGERIRYLSCKFSFDSNVAIFTYNGAGAIEFRQCEFVLADTSTAASAVVAASGGEGGTITVEACTFSGTLTYRTASLISGQTNTRISVNDMDVSGLTNITSVVGVGATDSGNVTLDGLKLASGVALTSALMHASANKPSIATRCDANNYGILHDAFIGSTVDGDKTRDGGASDGDRHSWKVVTTANCNKADVYYTPWMPVWVATTGSKTFTVYIGNADADLTDTECWLEVDHLGTSSSTVPTITTDRNADILAAGTAQTDDAASDWDADLTYMQSLAVTATVNKAGLQRCRVGFAKASATVYVDPMVTVS